MKYILKPIFNFIANLILFLGLCMSLIVLLIISTIIFFIRLLWNPVQLYKDYKRGDKLDFLFSLTGGIIYK